MNTTKTLKLFFTKQLLHWHQNENLRALPWKQETDPYKIWLSEIILQQTRAEQGLPYYLKFTQQYPTVEELANAPDEEVFRMWQGLGYYNRCKNLLHTARTITTNLKGRFPDTHSEILALKGIGEYTAAAIASFAFGLPYAVVDGNVHRVLARFFGIETPVDSSEGKKEFQTLASELLDKENSAAYNQAIMDHGATVCTPAAPKCNECIFQKNCLAFQKEAVSLFPVKSKSIKVRKRYFHYLLLRHENKLWLKKRTEKDIWQNLYEPFLIEHDHKLNVEELTQHPTFGLIKKAALSYTGSSTQRLTHQQIEATFFTMNVAATEHVKTENGEWIPIELLKKIPFPKTLVSFLEKNFYF
ncbi:MAG TPA: A/G-specific adenine glycosylase [Flavipsychrobacter sp.]|nr:A/G-specific adenine glycosylase [Flavipsychrobacter sp.]